MPTDWKAMASHYRNSIGRTRLRRSASRRDASMGDTPTVINSKHPWRPFSLKVFQALENVHSEKQNSNSMKKSKDGFG
jgi:hypothetical protein